MFPTKDGKKFGSAYVAKKKDAMHSMPMGESKEESRTNPSGEALFSKAEASAPDNDVKTNPESVDPSAVASEHGPASSVTVHHDHKNNKHHVVSRHPDNHMHTSDHASAAEAHNAGAQLAGEANTENDNKPANAEQQSGGDLYGNDGFKMPKLA
jgi:hypothetical protein